MKNIIITGIIALTVFSSCQWICGDCDCELEPEPVDSLAIHNQVIFQQLTDTLASFENLEVISYFLYYEDGSPVMGHRTLPDGSLEWMEPEPWWNINDQIFLLKTYYPDNIFQTFIVSPQDDRLVINAERIVYRDDYMSVATVTVPYEYIDSVTSQLLYYSDLPEYLRRFEQSLGDDWIEEEPVQEALVLHMPVDLREVADIDIETISPIPTK